MDKRLTAIILDGEIEKVKQSLSVIIEKTPERLEMITKYTNIINKLKDVKNVLKRLPS
ncbi:MAG: hypothetical protein ACOVK2_05175 [Candidatus Fonsibacter sp.]